MGNHCIDFTCPKCKRVYCPKCEVYCCEVKTVAKKEPDCNCEVCKQEKTPTMDDVIDILIDTIDNPLSNDMLNYARLIGAAVLAKELKNHQ